MSYGNNPYSANNAYTGDSQMRAEWQQQPEMRNTQPCPHDPRGCGCGQPQTQYNTFQGSPPQSQGYGQQQGYGQPSGNYSSGYPQPQYGNNQYGANNNAYPGDTQMRAEWQQQPSYAGDTMIPCNWHKGGHSIHNPCRGPGSPN